MKVVWDEEKNLANQKRHGVSFQEARVLFDPGRDYLEIFDKAHSDEEGRFRRVWFSSCTPRVTTRTPFVSSAHVGRRNGSKGSFEATWQEVDDERYT